VPQKLSRSCPAPSRWRGCGPNSFVDAASGLAADSLFARRQHSTAGPSRSEPGCCESRSLVERDRRTDRGSRGLKHRHKIRPQDSKRIGDFGSWLRPGLRSAASMTDTCAGSVARRTQRRKSSKDFNCARLKAIAESGPASSRVGSGCPACVVDTLLRVGAGRPGDIDRLGNGHRLRCAAPQSRYVK